MPRKKTSTPDPLLPDSRAFPKIKKLKINIVKIFFLFFSFFFLSLCR